MTRRPTRWWSRLFATPPDAFLKTTQGKLLLRLLTDWWIAGEGIANGTATSVNHSGWAAGPRYDELAFYRMLKQANYPPLPDRDEHAVDRVYRAFFSWATSRKARKLIDSIDVSQRAKVQIEAAIKARERDLLSDDEREQVVAGLSHEIHTHLHHDIHHQVHAQVHQQVHAQVHAQVHQQVHHAISHAAIADGGHGGGGGHH